MSFNKLVLLAVASLLWMNAAADGEDVDKSLPASADTLVSVNVQRGSVKLRGWDKNEVRVYGTLDEQTREFIFEERGDEIRIHVRVHDRKNGWFSDGQASDLTINIPSSSKIEFGGVSTDVDVRDFEGVVDMGVVSGDLYLEGGSGRVTVQTVSGDIEIHDSDGRVRVKSVSGDVESYNTTGDSSYSSVSGDLLIEDGGRDLRLETVSGDVEVNNKEMDNVGGHSVSGDIKIKGDPVAGGTIEFDSVSGSIRLRLGGDVNASFDIETGSGSIRNRISDDKPRVSKYMRDDTLRFSLGDGEGQVIITTRSGDISIGSR
ncbi:MAG: DUF4097 family beta strand repeat protein [Gammaproteobacteria bacterium]|nr:DUF4097 family beta strand repeat protein [Gammaproteobacteria bacterium]MBT4492994.1 DUF4097 family beta strand repeat protein [Gammaproteobacteria bacterium]MBT7371207.1 DUF4097 family beta strand repeat protein [Gammaproteobacteria bacterium]